MINAGAITASSLLPGSDPSSSCDALLTYLGDFVDHPLVIDEPVYASEAATGHRNRAIAHLLRSVRRDRRRPGWRLRRLLPAVLDPGRLPATSR